MTRQGLLRKGRGLITPPQSMAAGGLLARTYGRLVANSLRFVSARCLLRSGSRVYMVSATFIANLLRPGDRFFDVGAYDGMMSLIGASSVSAKGEVHAFEPNPVAFQAMRSMLTRYGVRKVAMNNCAVGDRERRAVLHIPTCETGASLSPAEKLVTMEGARTVDCDVSTLDDYVARNCDGHVPALVKIDVEGAELDVFIGGAALFSGANRPMVVFEACAENLRGFGRTVDDVLSWLAARGYSFYVLQYPELIEIARTSSSSSYVLDEQWTDVLAIVPTLHADRLASLRRRFRIRQAPAGPSNESPNGSR